MDEDFALVEKILKDVNCVLFKNPDLSSFDIVPVESNIQNKSPVHYLEFCLGLESWCVKHVYKYCYSELMDKHVDKPNRKALKISSVNSDRLAQLLNVTLLLNPELSTFWNKRREMILKQLLEKHAELQFTQLVLSRKPKCNDAFAHRRWIVQAALCDDSLHTYALESILNTELSICELTADKSPNNYHSWNHRMWVVKVGKQVDSKVNIIFLYIKEYTFSASWTSKHISDFSCFHYRQFCIKNILNYALDNPSWKLFSIAVDVDLRKNFVRVLTANFSRDLAVQAQASENNLSTYSEEDLINFLLCYTFKTCSCIKDSIQLCRKLEVLFHELVLNNELLRFFKHHETLWYHRRFIIHEILASMYDHFGFIRQNGLLVKDVCQKCHPDDRQKQAKMVRFDSNHIHSSVLYNVVLTHEKKFVEERRDDSDNYADRHEKYLKFIEGFNSVL